MASSFVTVDVLQKNGPACWKYRIDIEKYRSYPGESEKELLVKGLCAKKPGYAHFFQSEACSYAFLSEDSNLFETGMTSPVTSHSRIICTLPAEEYSSESSAVRERTWTDLSTSGSIFKTAMEAACSQSFNLADSTLLNNLGAINGVPVLASTPVRDEIVTMSTFSQGTLQSGNDLCCQQSSNNQPTKRSSIGKKLLLPQERTFDRSKFKLPQYFREDIDAKIRMKDKLNTKQENFICRELVRKIEKQTLGPPRDDLRWVAQQFLDRYPHLVFNNAFEATALSWTDKISGCLSRKRSELGYVIAENGRPPKDKVKVYVQLQESNRIDDVSYKENVKKMNEVFEKTPTSIKELESLQDLTFKARRFYFTTPGKIPEGDLFKNVLGDHCLLFKEIHFLFRELDKILGPGTCENFRNNWTMIVPKVVTFGKSKIKAKKVKGVFSNFNSKPKDYQALALLPVLIGSDINNRETKKPQAKRKKNDMLQMNSLASDAEINHPVYLFEEIKAPMTLDESLRHVPRGRPFIALIHDTFHIVIEEETFYKIDSSPQEALLVLMSCYFVFHLQYDPAVKPTLWFLQKNLLGTTETVIDKCHRVRRFHLELAATQVDPSDSSSESSDY